MYNIYIIYVYCRNRLRAVSYHKYPANTPHYFLSHSIQQVEVKTVVYTLGLCNNIYIYCIYNMFSHSFCFFLPYL